MNRNRNPETLLKRIGRAKRHHIAPLRMEATTQAGAQHTFCAINEVSLLRETRQTAKLEVTVDDKVRIAKQIIRTNCLVIEQLVEILEEITFDEGQLDLAKFAYEHIYDLENYYQVYGVFSFSSSGEELDEYIQDRE